MATKYVILHAVEPPNDDKALIRWEQVLEPRKGIVVEGSSPPLIPLVISATGQEAALTAFEATLPEDAMGTWKAVPLRSWKGGRTLTPKTQRVRSLFKD